MRNKWESRAPKGGKIDGRTAGDTGVGLPAVVADPHASGAANAGSPHPFVVTTDAPLIAESTDTLRDPDNILDFHEKAPYFASTMS